MKNELGIFTGLNYDAMLAIHIVVIHHYYGFFDRSLVLTINKLLNNYSRYNIPGKLLYLLIIIIDFKNYFAIMHLQISLHISLFLLVLTIHKIITGNKMNLL